MTVLDVREVECIILDCQVFSHCIHSPLIVHKPNEVSAIAILNKTVFEFYVGMGPIIKSWNRIVVAIGTFNSATYLIANQTIKGQI